MRTRWLFVVPAVMGVACSDSDGTGKTDDQYKAEVTTSVRSYIQGELETWYTAAKDLQAAAPTTAGRGWDPATDKEAIAKMKEAWRRARVAYEHIEGALAPIFPELDAATDERYDGFLSDIKQDNDLFDGEGVTGMHAIERILYSDSIPATVVTFESALSGYVKAAFPKTEAEAKSFKEKLCAQLVTDVNDEKTQFADDTKDFDLAFAYQGTLDLIAEQQEKVDKAATGEEESRYSQLTMLDLHSNYTGNQTVYKAFQPWLQAKGAEGKALDEKIMAGLGRLNAAYSAAPDPEKMPAPPATWSSTNPTDADKKTPFGILFLAVQAESDVTIDGSLASDMTKAGALLKLEAQ